MCQPGSCWKTARVAGETFSARTIFMDPLIPLLLAVLSTVAANGVGDGTTKIWSKPPVYLGLLVG
jgi:hypothetical protein